ncbi:MAG: leucine-rich repeat protein [Terrisporobacter sp.]|uniref:leucine-rich repeat protein n=1 Tax=Terrisporobacter sp. TaxID=1965305 RepID=UPI002FC707DA
MDFLISVAIIAIVVTFIYFISNKNSKSNYKKTSLENKKKTSSKPEKNSQSESNTGATLTLNTLNKYVNPKKSEDLIKYSIPSSFSILDDNALKECINLTELCIHDKLFLLQDKSFINCVNLININVHEDNKNYYSKLGVLFSKDHKQLITYPSSKQSSTYFIPQEVENINSHAFTNNKYLKYIIVPNSVTTISENAFVNCKSIKQIVVPQNVITIHPRAFSICPRLSVRGYRNSIAENYCKKYYIPFEYLSN